MDKKGIVVVIIILGLIGVIASLPADNTFKRSVVSAVDGATGGWFSKKLNQDDGKQSPGKSQSKSSGPLELAKVELPAIMPFDEGHSTGSAEADGLRQKANADDAEAQFLLGKMYQNGEEVEMDRVIAYMWFNIAKANGYEGAKEAANIIDKKMTTDELNLSQEMSSLWWRKYK